MFFFQLDSWYLVIKLDTDMPFIYKFLCQRNQSAKKDCKQNVDIQTSNFAITRSADDVPWTFKNVKREPF